MRKIRELLVPTRPLLPTEVVTANADHGGPALLLGVVRQRDEVTLLVLEETLPQCPRLRLLGHGCLDMQRLSELTTHTPFQLAAEAYRLAKLELPGLERWLTLPKFMFDVFQAIEQGPLVLQVPGQNSVKLFCCFGILLSVTDFAEVAKLLPQRPNCRLIELKLTTAGLLVATPPEELRDCLPEFAREHDLHALSGMIARLLKL
jgi:hypothetical protein